MKLRRWWSAAVLATLTLEASEAAAYCRTHTCDPTQENCDRQDDGCIISGHPLFWPTECTSFGVHKLGSPLRGITFEQASAIITEGYQKWISVNCEGGLPAIQVSPKGAIECGKPEYNQTAPNANVWMFRDTDWPYDSPFATLALTTITFNTQNGEIYDADVEINSATTEITTGDENVHADLDSIVTHEIGHFFGLSHSSVPGSTMIAEYRPGQTEIRSLDPDDQAGVCEIYPPGREGAQNKNCAPRHGFSRNCAPQTESTCSTVVARPDTPEPHRRWFALGLAGLAVGVVVRRRGAHQRRARRSS